MPGRIELVHDSPVCGGSATSCSSVEIACRIREHSCKRYAPIRSARKAVERGRMARSIQLVHDSRAPYSATACSPVEVADGVAYDSSVGKTSIHTLHEAMKHTLLA